MACSFPKKMFCIPSCLKCVPLMFCIHFCLLNKHTESTSSVADFFFPPFSTGHGLLAVISVYKGGAAGTRWLSHCMCTYLFFLPFAYEVVHERSS